MKPSSLFVFRCFTWSMVLFVILAVPNCRKKSETVEKKPTVTIENLQTAFGTSLKRAAWYKQYADQAEKDRRSNVVFLFRAVARSEEIHASNHAKLLRLQGVEPKQPQIDAIALGSVTQSLKMAISSEGLETDALYPNLLRTAEIEKFTEAVTQFKQTRDADARHRELFKAAADNYGNIGRVSYFICPECGYILTSDKASECPTCKTKKEMFEKI